MIHDGVLPAALESKEDDGSRGYARLHVALQELKGLLEPRRNSIAEGQPRRENPRDEDPDWATAQFHLGLGYAQSAEGDPSQNWERAIAAFENALSVWTRERNRRQWAAARMGLGVAYRERLAGDRSDNQERAIAAFEDSLSIVTREGNPEQWPAARMNLGIAYWERLAGDRSENQERAIRAFEDSLLVWTRDDNPDDWATAQLNLAFAYQERGIGKQSANRERAIAAFENSLLVFNRERNPREWAAARMSLGIAYWERLPGERSQNQELAIGAFEDALSVRTREADPEGWATAHMNLGVAYWERLAGDQSENREQAVGAFEDALSVWARETNPEPWAAVRMRLGVAYQERLTGDRSQNQERAIAAFEDALSVWTCETNPDGWAAAQMKLGIAYRDRLAGNRSENLERAIPALEKALRVWAGEHNPEEVGLARANLDAAYRERFAEWLENRVSIGPVAAQDFKVIGLVSSAHFMSHFFQIVLPPIFPLLKDAFGVSYTELAIVMSLMYATSGLMQTSAGLIVDRLGPAPVLIGGLALYSVAVLLYGFAPNLWVLAALAVAAGFGNCVFHPADYAILSARVGATRLGRAYGVHNLGGSLGWAAAPAAVLALTELFGWRVALSVLGGVGLLLTLYLAVQAAALTVEGRTGGSSEAAPVSARVFLSRPILVCFGYFVLLAVATVTLQAFLPSSLVSGFGISLAVANGALTGFLVGSAVGMFVGGIIVDYFGRQELVVAIGLLTAAVASLSIGALALPIAALVVIIAVGGFAWGCTTPSRDMLVRGAAPAGAMGAVVGFVYSGLDLGSAVTPPFLGLLLDHHLPRLIFVVTAGILLLAISTAFLVGRNNAGRRTVPYREVLKQAAIDSVA
jgi:FSR family fosmidomycin resistance protein-like MFS transporter